MGSTTLQITLTVGTSGNGSINTVSGSGISSMSETLMDWKPRMEEPSKPMPSSNISSVNASIGIEK
jgi:hypothetical protein